MADIGTLSTSLAYWLAQAIYPAGISNASLTGRRTIVRRGYFLPTDLAGPCGLRSGVDYVTVHALGTSYRQQPFPLGAPWRDLEAGTCTVAAAVSGQTVTLSVQPGVTPAGIIGLSIHTSTNSMTPDRVAVSYAVQPTDTAATIALGLAVQIPGSAVSGASVMFPDALSIEVRTGGIGTAWRSVRRQTQTFTVTLWSNGWQSRDALGSALDAALSDARWLPTPDPESAQVQVNGIADIDAQQASGIFRREVRLAVTYDTIQIRQAATMVFGTGLTDTTMNAGVATLTTFGSVPPVVGVASDQPGQILQDGAGNLVMLVRQPYTGVAMDANGNVVEDSAGNLVGFPA